MVPLSIPLAGILQTIGLWIALMGRGLRMVRKVGHQPGKH